MALHLEEQQRHSGLAKRPGSGGLGPERQLQDSIHSNVGRRKPGELPRQHPDAQLSGLEKLAKASLNVFAKATLRGVRALLFVSLELPAQHQPPEARGRTGPRRGLLDSRQPRLTQWRPSLDGAAYLPSRARP